MIWMSFANRNSIPVNLKLLQVEKKVTKFYQVKEQFLCKYFYKDWFWLAVFQDNLAKFLAEIKNRK